MDRFFFNCRRIIACLPLFVCCIAEPVQAIPTATFTGIGHVPGASSSYVHGISADGSVVVGYSSGGDISSERALKWSQQTGIVDLGFPGGGNSSEAWAASWNGDIIVGTAREGYGFRWTPATGMSLFSDDYHLRPMAISDDETTIAGGGFYDTIGGWHQAFRWTNGTGAVRLGALGGFGESEVRDLSADGSVLVGWSRNYGPEQAFRWTRSNGMQALTASPSTASAISADGKVIVGHVAYGSNSTPRAAFRWTQQTGLILLQPPSDIFEWQNALGVSSDGSRIVGSRDTKAIIWEELIGMRDLRDVLINEYDLVSNLQGWHLIEATGISANGRIITGNGVNPQGNPEAWVVTLPVPEPQGLVVIVSAFIGAYGVTVQRRTRSFSI